MAKMKAILKNASRTPFFVLRCTYIIFA